MTTRSDPTEQDEKNIDKILDYMSIYPNALVRFHASDMILRADTDASYLTEPKACSHDVGDFLLGSIPSKCAREQLNGPIHVNFNI